MCFGRLFGGAAGSKRRREGVDPVQAEPQRGEALLPLLPQLLGEVVGGVFGPRHPHLFDVHAVEHGLRIEEARDVVPVLVRDHEHIELLVGRLGDVLGDGGDERLCFWGAEDHATIDEEVKLLPAALGEGEQEAIAQPLAVHADADTGRPVAAFRGVGGRSGLSCRGCLARLGRARAVGRLLCGLPEELWEIAWRGLTCWNADNAPPLPERELRSVFDSIARREHRKRHANGGGPATGTRGGRGGQDGAPIPTRPC